MGKTTNLTDFLSKITYKNLPKDVVEMTKKCIFDYIGCTVFAAQTDMGQIVRAVCKEGNFGKSNIFPSLQGKYDAGYAALANGTCAHGFEIDDVHLPSISHPGAVVISTALALGQEREVTGKKFIEAIVAGYEAMARIGSALGAAHVDFGHHPTASHGVFGAAATAAKILGLTSEQMACAFGLAGSLASGLMQFSLSGTMVKRIHAGKAAQQGVIVAKLAEKGFTGPTDILEGDFGYCAVYRGNQSREDVEMDLIDVDLGKHYWIMETAVKPSPACGCLHAVIECMQKINKEEGFRPEEVTEIIVRGHKNLVEVHNDYTPKSILAAQYSLPFTIGLSMAANIEDPSIYLAEEVLNNKQALKYASLVKTEPDEEIQRQFPKRFGAKVEVKTSGGKIYHQTVYAQKGSAENPFSLGEVVKKYSMLTENTLSKEESNKLEAVIKSMENVKNVRDLFIP